MICSLFVARKTLRQSTKAKSEAATIREQEREVKVKIMKDIAAKKNVRDVRRLTQEELLEEAKETEILNQESLGEYFPHFLSNEFASPNE